MESVRVQNIRVHICTPYLSVLSPNARKYRPEKLRIQTLCTQCSITLISQLLTAPFSLYSRRYTHSLLDVLNLYTLN